MARLLCAMQQLRSSHVSVGSARSSESRYVTDIASRWEAGLPAEQVSSTRLVARRRPRPHLRALNHLLALRNESARRSSPLAPTRPRPHPWSSKALHRFPISCNLSPDANPASQQLRASWGTPTGHTISPPPYVARGPPVKAEASRRNSQGAGGTPWGLGTPLRTSPSSKLHCARSAH